MLQEQWKNTLVKTINDVIGIDSPQMSSIIFKHRKEGETLIMANLINEINKLLSFLNLKLSMNDDQLLYTCELILEDFSYLRMEDITVFVKMVCKGLIGKVYDRIDGNMIIGWLREYDSKKCEAIEMRHRKQKKSELGQVTLSDEKIDELRKTIGVRKIEPIKSSFQDSDYVRLFLNEFDSIWNEQSKDSENCLVGSRLIKHNGDLIDQTEYVKRRINENKPTENDNTI